MRRKDLEITESAAIQAVLKDCPYCHVGLRDGEKVYVLPLNFGFAEKDGKYTLYFHSAKEGRKIDLLEKNRWAAFEMTADYKLNENEVACGHSVRYRCLTGGGAVTFLTDEEEKRQGLLAIMEHMTGRRDWTFGDGAFKATTVFKLEVEELSGKAHG